MRPYVRLNTDVPALVTLGGWQPRETTNRDGNPEWEYTVKNQDGDEALLYLPPEAHNAIKSSGATQGNDIQILKTRLGKKTTWKVGLVEDEPAPRHAQQQPAAAPAADRSPDASWDRNLKRPGAAILAGALMTALDAVLEARRYAANKHNFDLKLDAQDIRALAITLYIDARKEAK